MKGRFQTKEEDGAFADKGTWCVATQMPTKHVAKKAPRKARGGPRGTKYVAEQGLNQWTG